MINLYTFMVMVGATAILVTVITNMFSAFRQKQTPKQRLVVYRTPQHLSRDASGQIKASLQGIFEDSCVVVVSGGATLEIHEAA